MSLFTLGPHSFIALCCSLDSLLLPSLPPLLSVYVPRIPNGAKLLLIRDLFVFTDTFLEESKSSHIGELVHFRAAFLLCSLLLTRLFAFAFFASFPIGAKILLIHELFAFADNFLEE